MPLMRSENDRDARPLHLDLRHLRLVAAVAESGGQTRAARRLNLTQSALSHQLRELEGRIGSPLFIRASRHMVLTAVGERILGTARRVLHEVETLERDLAAESASGGAGVVRLATECYTCYHWLPPLLMRYRRKFPRVEVRIDVEATRAPIEGLLAGRLDLAIVSAAVSDRRLVTKKLFEDEVVLIAARDHRFAQQPHVRLSDLRDETFYIYPPRAESRVLQEVLLPAGISPRVEEVQLTEAITELVKAGLGVAALARWAVQPLVDSGALVARSLTARGVHREWRAAMPRDLARADYITEFVELFEKHAPTARATRAPRLVSARSAR
jgi:LysR family transcriptional regulator for metE and metH